VRCFACRHLAIVGGVRERLVVTRRGRGKTACARGAEGVLLGGPSTSPLDSGKVASALAGSLCRPARTGQYFAPDFPCRGTMRYDESKIDEVVLAVLYLTAFERDGATFAWKGIDWEATNRLFERGLIDDPKGKAKSILFTSEGLARAKVAANRLFAP
jgi:Domain of unknown function (DUF6429)